MTEIHLSYGESTSFDIVMGFELAGQWWSDILEDEVDLYLHIDGTDKLPENVVGGALPAIESKQKYEDIRDSLIEDISSSTDQEAVSFLTESKEFSITANGDEDLNKTKELELTRANAKALGIEKSNNEKLDGYIVVSDLAAQEQFSWDFGWQRDAEFSQGNLDFFAVALHEIGHTLGFVSGIDASKWQEVVVKRQEKLDEDIDGDKPAYFKDDAMKYAHPLDLFRYSREGYEQGKQDLSIGHDTYFSLDGGATALADFSTGKATELGGDGYQASHWKQGNDPIGIMDPVLNTHQRRTLSEIDLQALDAIGWDIKEDGLSFDLQENLAVVESRLAARIGIDPHALNENQDRLLQEITSDRTKDVLKMIKDSDAYEWGSRRWSRSGSRWQEVIDLLGREGKFMTLDQIQDGSNETPQVSLGESVQPVSIQHDFSHDIGQPNSVIHNASATDFNVQDFSAKPIQYESFSSGLRVSSNLPTPDSSILPGLSILSTPFSQNGLAVHPLMQNGMEILKN